MDHDFGDSLAYSHSCQDAPFWEIVYRQWFPGFQCMVNVRKDGPRQRLGMDRIVILDSGRNIPIDEKARRKAYNDIALEVVADEQRGAPGWVRKDLMCEFISYAKVPQQRCFLLPTLPLQAAFQRHGDQWQRRYGLIRAHNLDRRTGRRWVTLSVPVPDAVLFDGLRNILCASWGVPPPTSPPRHSKPSTAFAHQGDLFGCRE